MVLHPVVRQKMTRLLALVLVIEIIVIAVIWLTISASIVLGPGR